MPTLSDRLIVLVRQGEHERAKASAEYAGMLQKYKLTAEGKAEERAKLNTRIKSSISSAITEGLDAIDSEIARLDRQESERARARSLDNEYLQRLNFKLSMLRSLDLQNTPDSELKTLCAEYENDPLALSSLGAIIGSPMRCVNILPSDTNGQRQDRLRKVRKNFESIMERCADLILDTNRESVNAAISLPAIIANFILYLQTQSDDFSRPDDVVWEAMHQSAQKTGVGEPKFDFHFKSVH